MNEEEKKSKKRKSTKLLVAIIVILIIFLTALTLYVVIDKDNEKEIKFVKLTVDLNGGMDDVDYKEKYAIGDKIILTEPTKDGYKFVEWQVQGGSLIDNKLTINNDTIVKAIWREKNPDNGTINYEVKKDDTYGWYDLYIDGKEVSGIYSSYEPLEVEVYKDVLIVEEKEEYLYIVDKEANVTKLDYYDDMLSESNFIDYIMDSYRIDENNLYIKVRRDSNYRLFWYCSAPKDYIVEYEVKYEYLNGEFISKQIVNQIELKDKYKDNMCPNYENDKMVSYNKEQTKQFIYDFPYSKILEDGNTYHQLWYTYILNKTNISDEVEFMYCEPGVQREAHDKLVGTKDKNGEVYPNYKRDSIESLYMTMGLTVEEINKKDLDNIQICNTYMVDGEIYRKNIEKKFGNYDSLFKQSFSFESVKAAQIFSFNLTQYVYDKGIDKVLKLQACAGGLAYPNHRITEILTEREENNNYIIQYVEGAFIPEKEDTYMLTKDFSSNEVIDVYNIVNEDSYYDLNDELLRDLLIKNKDKLNKYEVTFEKTKDGYIYKSIKKIDNVNKLEALNCTYDGELVQGAEYVNGQYTYRYMQEAYMNLGKRWRNIEHDGWGVILTDHNSDLPAYTSVCTTINNKPVVSTSSMYAYTDTQIINLSSFDMKNVINTEDMFSHSAATIGYARTQEDADKLNKISNKPESLTFIAKEQSNTIYENKINLKNIKCDLTDNNCTKKFNINYNGKNHEVKIIQHKKEEIHAVPSYVNKMSIYIDNKLIETIEDIYSGTDDLNFDGYAYVFDSKYLGILYSSYPGTYGLNIYSDGVKIGEEGIISMLGVYKDELCNDQLNTLDNLEFDGNKLLFYERDCADKFYKKSLTIENNKIVIKEVERLENLYGCGGATC